MVRNVYRLHVQYKADAELNLHAPQPSRVMGWFAFAPASALLQCVGHTTLYNQSGLRANDLKVLIIEFVHQYVFRLALYVLARHFLKYEPRYNAKHHDGLQPTQQSTSGLLGLELHHLH